MRASKVAEAVKRLARRISIRWAGLRVYTDETQRLTASRVNNERLKASMAEMDATVHSAR